MNTISKIAAFSICTSLTAVTPALANDETTAVLQELFALYSWEPVIGNVDDASRSTRWNDVKIIGGDDTATFNVAWVEASKNLLGGYSVTMAEEMTVSGELPDGEGEMTGVVSSEGMEIAVSGKVGARVFDVSFDKLNSTVKAGDLFEMNMVLGAGSSQTTVDGGVMAGAFDYPSVDLTYKVSVEGQTSDVDLQMSGITGNYRTPVLAGEGLEKYQALWNGSERYFADYTIPKMDMKMVMGSPAGPVNVTATVGEQVGRLAATDGVVSIGGTGNDVAYKVSAMGMPPMNVTLEKSDVTFAVPLDNVDDAKQAVIQLGLTGLELDPMLWAMFDPQGVLPKDKANLEIDLTADMKWAQKMDAFDATKMATGLPVDFDNVKINALNLNAMGAELKTDGAFNVDSSSFPPVASGTANVSTKGVDALMGKLMTAGLLPAQYGMMAKGMMGVFFKQGGEGVDHLVSQITIAPDGSISANGFPLK
jgi:hypothetical protein